MMSKEEARESHTKAQAKYDRDHTTRIGLKLNNQTDADILEWLDAQESKQGAIKQLIRQDIAKCSGFPSNE